MMVFSFRLGKSTNNSATFAKCFSQTVNEEGLSVDRVGLSEAGGFPDGSAMKKNENCLEWKKTRIFTTNLIYCYGYNH